MIAKQENLQFHGWHSSSHPVGRSGRSGSIAGAWLSMARSASKHRGRIYTARHHPPRLRSDLDKVRCCGFRDHRSLGLCVSTLRGWARIHSL